MPDAREQNPVEANAYRLLAVMVEQNLRECSNAQLQALTAIEDRYDVNDALERLEEHGAIEVKWAELPGSPAYARISLKGKGKSLYHSQRNQSPMIDTANPISTANFYGNVGNVAIGSQHFEQHARVQPTQSQEPKTPIRLHSIDAETSDSEGQTSMIPRLKLTHILQNLHPSEVNTIIAGLGISDRIPTTLNARDRAAELVNWAKTDAEYTQLLEATRQVVQSLSQ